MKKLGLVLGPVIGLVFLLAACGGDNATSTPLPTVEPTATPEAMMMMEAGDVLLVALNEQNASGQTGWVTLTAKGNQTEVVLAVLPGALESELVHIHSGVCGNDTLGSIAHGLTNIAGGASVTTVDASLSSLRTGDFAINSHQMGNPGTYTTCGNIPAS